MNVNKELSTFFRNIVLSTNREKFDTIYKKFQSIFPNGFPFTQFKNNEEVTSRFTLVKNKLDKMENVPASLLTLMQRLNPLIHQTLSIDPIIGNHLEGNLHLSFIDNIISSINLAQHSLSYHNLKMLLGSDWNGYMDRSINGTDTDFIYTIYLFNHFVGRAAQQDATTQSQAWKESGLYEQMKILESHFSTLNSNNLIERPRTEDLKQLINTKKKIYLPIGYANGPAFFFNLIAVDHWQGAYRLRLFSADNSPILAATNKLNHYCPEVIWEGLTLEQVDDPLLWKPLLEVSNLKEDQVFQKDNDHYFAFSSVHIITWLIRYLKQQPLSLKYNFPESDWQKLLDNQYRPTTAFVDDISQLPTVTKKIKSDLLLKPTGKEIKHTSFSMSLNKFINLLAIDILPDNETLLLYKAESRLIILVAAFTTFKKELYSPVQRGEFLCLMQLSFGKITAPLEKLNHREETKRILASIIDLKHRLADFVHHSDKITLGISQPLYKTTNQIHLINTSAISWQPIERTFLGNIRLDNHLEPLASNAQWTAKDFPKLYASLEAWYDRLLDAKDKCETAEIMLTAHKNIFSRLPIPTTNQVEETFPDPISEGLQVGTLILLKKISSLVASEIYTDSFIPPVFIADMTRVYRFCVELYRHINPLIIKKPISWFCLYQYMESRHSFHAPGEIEKTLETLVLSFKALNPKGHLRPSRDYPEIPLFYFFDSLPKEYKFHRLDLGPPSAGNSKSVDEILTIAELADSIGIPPEETNIDSNNQRSEIKWLNSFGGQCLITLEQIAQYYTMSIMASSEVFIKTTKGKNYFLFYVNGHLGPEDYFKIQTIHNKNFTKNSSSFSPEKGYAKSVYNANIPMPHRLVELKESTLLEPLKSLPIELVDQWREQADLIKFLPKHSPFVKYYLHQISSGPSSQSIDVLLEYFENRTALLFNNDYRGFFSATIRSAHVLKTSSLNEQLLFERLKDFTISLYNDDHDKCHESLHMERLLWTFEIIHHLSKISLKTMIPLLKKVIDDFRHLNSVAIAPHILALNFLFKESMLEIYELARFHLLAGRSSMTKPNQLANFYDSVEAMQAYAPKIQEALLNGDKKIWALILDDQDEIDSMMMRVPQKLDLTTVLKTSALLSRLELRQRYFETSMIYFRRFHARTSAWRETATNKLIEKLNVDLKQTNASLVYESTKLAASASSLLCYTRTSCLFQLNAKTIYVDWETGRTNSSIKNLPPSSQIPIHLRKHPDLSLLSNLLRNPLPRSSDSSCFYFEGTSLSIDEINGITRLTVANKDYRLVSQSSIAQAALPPQFREGFTLWMDMSEGILAVHSSDGTPIPVFRIDLQGAIHPLTKNTHLRLAATGYYPEAQIFNRWGIEQSEILVWLDEHNHVAEVHLPFHNGSEPFTRVTHSQTNGWEIQGLDIFLEQTKESIPAFAGHPVYLVGKTKQGEQLLLLSGIDPYTMKNRKMDFTKQGFAWNKILAIGATDKIHQFRVLQNGQVEGLTVADNLFLMLWKFYMGDYIKTIDLAKRWLTPPGRPYNIDEVNVLLNWTSKTYGYRSEFTVFSDNHPSAVACNLYITLQIQRHLHHYASSNPLDKKSLKLANRFLGDRSKSYKTLNIIAERLSSWSAFGHQIKGTELNELISEYDHEMILRLLNKEDLIEKSAPLYTRLFYRQNKHKNEIKEDAISATNQIDSLELHSHAKYENHGHYTLEQIIESYATTIQLKNVPIEKLIQTTVQINIIQFFDKAYLLIKNGPSNENEFAEYRAVESILLTDNFRQKNLCFQTYILSFNLYTEGIDEKNIMLWILLNEAYKAKKSKIKLPDLPKNVNRFGLVLMDTIIATKNFFYSLITINNGTANALLKTYLSDWFMKRDLRYFKQRTALIPPSNHFYQSLETDLPQSLTQEINRWSTLPSDLKPKVEKDMIQLDNWSFPIPEQWMHKHLTDKNIRLLTREVSERLENVSKETQQRKQTLLMLANALPKEDSDKELARQLHYIPPKTLDECILLTLQGKSSLKHQKQTLLYLEAALDEAHLLRIHELLKKCAANFTDRNLLEKLVEALNTPHTYLPSTTTLPLMTSEYYANTRLRINPNQAHLINVLASESSVNHGSIIQAIMGSGKSQMLAPVWAQMMIGKGRIPIFCVPTPLFRSTVSQMQNMMWNRFKTNVKALIFIRDNCNISTLQNLAEMLFLARKEPTVFICTPRDLHALQLMLKERHQLIEDLRDRLKKYTLKAMRSNISEKLHQTLFDLLEKDDWDNITLKNFSGSHKWIESHKKLENELEPLLKEANLLQAILNLLQTESALLVDEVAAVYDPRNMLSFPIGWQERANPHAATVACKIYMEWLPQFYDRLELLNNSQTFISESTRIKIYHKLAKISYNYYREHLSDLPTKTAFTFYLLSDPVKGKVMQTYINNLQNQGLYKNQLAQEISFLKYCLSGGLEGALTSKANVNYGRSKQDPHLYLAIPYQSANVPKENTLFRSPWKTILMTCQLYSQVWNDPQQTAELIGYIRGIDPTSKDRTILDSATAIWGTNYCEASVHNLKLMQDMTVVLDKARADIKLGQAARLLIQAFLKTCVFSSQLKIDPSQLTSNPQDIPLISAKADAMGGTFGFETTWNPKLNRINDPSSDQKILNTLSETRNQTCHHLDKGGATALLKDLKNRKLSGYMSIIDVGAQFCGISNKDVAKKLLDVLLDYDCILFYDEAHLAVMSKNEMKYIEQTDREGVKNFLTQLKLSKPFVYYDQASCIGTDLALPNGKALVTFSDKVKIDDLLQACMRCRSLIAGQHSVEYAIPGEMEGPWNGTRVIQVAQEHQIIIEEKANFHAICEQMRGEIRSIIDHKIRSTFETEKRHKFYKSSMEFLVDQQHNDLVKTFNNLNELIDTQKALKSYARNLFFQADKFLPEAKDQIKKTLVSILNWHSKRKTPLPKMVKIGDPLEDAVQEVDLSKDQDRIRLMEEEYERMLGTRNPKKEYAWEKFDLNMLGKTEIGCITHSGNPDLYSLKDALIERGFPVPFDDRVLISENLLSTFIGESNCLLTDNQKPLHRCLFINRNDKLLLVLISENDARQLKEHLLKLNDGRGIYLIEPSGIINQRGDYTEDAKNLWVEGTVETRSLFLHAIIFQGNALLLDRLPRNEVKQALNKLTKDQSINLSVIRLLFDEALNLRPDDLQLYRTKPELRALFT